MLRDYLGDGPADLADIMRAAKALGISRSTLFRARAKLNADTKTSGFGKGKTTLWGLPSGQ